MSILPWILVWWIVVPGHAQEVHYKDFATQEACEEYRSHIQVSVNSIIRSHCSRQ